MIGFFLALGWLASHASAFILGIVVERYFLSRRGGGGDDDPGDSEAQRGRIAAL